MKKLWFLLVLLSFQIAKGQEAASPDSVRIQSFELTNLTTAAEETDEALRRAREAIEKNEDSFNINKRYQRALEKNSDLRNDTVNEQLESCNYGRLMTLTTIGVIMRMK